MIPQIRKLDTPESFGAHLRSLGLDLPFDEVVEPTGALAQPITIHDGALGELHVPNRFAVLPMEGWDGTPEGRPTDLVQRRWQRFAEGGAGLVWAEATAVCHEGRANPHQLLIDDTTVGQLASLRRLFTDGQVVGLQLTHSGRYSRPDGAAAPRTAYRHPLLDAPSGASEASLLTDGELDDLVALFVDRAVLAGEAGFDFVDVKACHGYLGHELLTAFDRPGPYGGDFVNRTRFMRSIIEGVRAAAPGLAIGVRFSVFDSVPYVPGVDGRGVPATDEPYRYAFGADDHGRGIDLREPLELVEMLHSLGVGLLCTTAGSPYYCPHVQRPAFFPPSDGYLPPEDPLVGVARQVAATAALTRRCSGDGGHRFRVFVSAGMAGERGAGGGCPRAGVDGGHRADGAVLSRPTRRCARRPPDTAAVAVPHVQRLHHSAPRRPGLWLLPARLVLQSPPRTGGASGSEAAHQRDGRKAVVTGGCR